MADYKSGWTGSEIDAGIQAARNALPKSGGTMTGALTLNGAPTSDLHAVTKKYVDDAVANGGDNAIADKAPAQHAEQHSWNDTLTWDGDETGRTVAVVYDDESGYVRFVHVSDAVPSRDNLANGVFYSMAHQNGTIKEWKEAPEDFIEENGVLRGTSFFIVPEENCTLDVPPVTFPKKGIYFTAITERENFELSYYCSSITIPNYNFSDISDPIRPEMISAAPSYHASESIKYGVGTDKKYGHLKIADLGGVLIVEEDGMLGIAPEFSTGDALTDLEDYAFGAYTGLVASNILFATTKDNTAMIDYHDDLIDTLRSQTLKQTDRQNIINDALNALAGADPNNATAAVVENLSGRTGVLETKFRNASEDISYLQRDLDNLDQFTVMLHRPQSTPEDPEKMSFVYTSLAMYEDYNKWHDDITLMSLTGDVYAGKMIDNNGLEYTREKLATEEYVQDALAGAGASDDILSRVSRLETKIINMAEDIAVLQSEVDEFLTYFTEYVVKIACRLVQIERTLNLQPPISTDGWDTATEVDDVYDNMEWQ